MNRPLSEGEKKAVLDTLVALISEHVAKLGELEDEVGLTRTRLTALRLQYAQLTGAQIADHSARDATDAGSDAR